MALGIFFSASTVDLLVGAIANGILSALGQDSSQLLLDLVPIASLCGIFAIALAWRTHAHAHARAEAAEPAVA